MPELFTLRDNSCKVNSQVAHTDLNKKHFDVDPAVEQTTKHAKNEITAALLCR